MRLCRQEWLSLRVRWRGAETPHLTVRHLDGEIFILFSIHGCCMFSTVVVTRLFEGYRVLDAPTSRGGTSEWIDDDVRRQETLGLRNGQDRNIDQYSGLESESVYGAEEVVVG